MNNVRAQDGTFACHPAAWTGIVKECLFCGNQLVLRNNRDITRRNYCSHHCRAKGAARTEAFRSNRKKHCAFCDKVFVAKTFSQKYCSTRCCSNAAIWGYKRRRAASQEGFFKHLIRSNNKRNGLTPELLIEIFERQHGRCAISGIEMTKIVGQGHVLTNVSIDRIDSSVGYAPGNVHLVCHIVNLMKHNMTTTELVKWCKAIINHQEK